ncbi:11363_t:CDS:2 [Funneliformis geosporum]|nr:11363_t:CDS:2 [Funneliformis geosporum]
MTSSYGMCVKHAGKYYSLKNREGFPNPETYTSDQIPWESQSTSHLPPSDNP